MRDVTKPAATGLTESFANKLLSGIAESRATTVIGGGGKPFLRLLKSDEWVFGQENEEVQEGSHWVINTMSLAHGWCCWVETAPNKPNELRGEIMISMTEPKPLCPPPIDGTSYKEQRSFECKCISGADAGQEVIYKNGSLGGMRAVDDILVEIQNQLLSPGGIAYPCPVVRFEKDSYIHKKHGKTLTPIFEVMGWADMEGHLQPDGRPVVAPEPEAAEVDYNVAKQPGARGKARKPPLEAVDEGMGWTDMEGHLQPDSTKQPGTRGKARKPVEPLQPAEPLSTTQAHVGQRRRPTAR